MDWLPTTQRDWPTAFIFQVSSDKLKVATWSTTLRRIPGLYPDSMRNKAIVNQLSVRRSRDREEWHTGLYLPSSICYFCYTAAKYPYISTNTHTLTERVTGREGSCFSSILKSKLSGMLQIALRSPNYIEGRDFCQFYSLLCHLAGVQLELCQILNKHLLNERIQLKLYC